MSSQSDRFKKWMARLYYINTEYPFGPLQEKRNADGRLHCDDGPAYISPTRVTWYQDGRRHGMDIDRWGSITYYYENVMVPKHFIDKPETLTIKGILRHKNTEVRHVGMKIYGYDRLLEEENNINVIHQEDGPFGRVLFEIPGIFRDPVRIVRVINATAELDGTHKQYFLNVPPTVETCQEAVAWTFRKEDHEYNPVQET